MRYVYSAAAIAIALSVLAPSAAFGQGGASNFSITNYQLQGEQHSDQTYVTYAAELVNTGPALAGVTATVSSLAPNVQVVAGQGTLHFSPVPANSQVHSSDSFTILIDRSVPFDWSQVQWSFQAPIANPGPSQTVPLGSTVTLNGGASTNASGIGGLTYSWSFVQLPAGSSAALSNANTMIATFVADVPGTYTICLTVSAGSASSSATVTASTLYAPPVASAGPNQSVLVGATVNLDGTKSSDVNGMPLTYSWSFISRPPNSFAAIFNPQSAISSFQVDVAGTYKVQLIVNDGQANSQPGTVVITTGNTPPVAVAACDSCVNLKVNALVQLDGSKSTDVDGDSLTYIWSLNTSGALGSKATLSNANIVNPTFTADVPGTYVAQLIVFDGKAQSQSSTVTIATDALLPPAANAGQDQSVHPGSTVQLSGSGNDPQSLTLTYSWSLITWPSGSMATLSATSIPNPTLFADQPGVYVAQLIVSDGYLFSNPSTVKVTSTDIPPVAVPALTNQGGVYVGNTVYLDGSNSYAPDGNPIVSYSWSLNVPPGSHAKLLNAGTASPNFVADIAGTYVAQHIVKDKVAHSAPATVSISVGTGLIDLSLVNNPEDILYSNSSGILTITLSPPPSSPTTVTLSGYDNEYDNGTAVDLPNSVIVPANSSGVNVTLGALALTDRISVTTTIKADAPGYYEGSLTVTVKTPTITLALNNNATTAGLNQSAGGTITLNAPAPAPSGTNILLSYISSPDGAVSFANNSITIPAGSTTGSFSITGTTAGHVTTMATAPGYRRATLDLDVVTLSIISFSPQAVSVGAGGVQSFNILLSAPAPTGGLPIVLSSDATGVAAVSPGVSIVGGGTSGTAQITGVAPGTAHITGSTTNQSFSAANASVTVSVSMQLTITTASLPYGTPGAPYTSTTLAASGGTGQGYTWSVTVGQLPSGLTLSSAGVLSGTLSNSATNSSFTVQVQDSGGNKATQQFTVTVGTQLTITTGSLPNGTPGAPYTSTTLAASGGTGQGYTWSVTVGQIPSGLTLSSAGVLSGTLSTSATNSTFTVQVQDSGGNKATQQFTITVGTQLTIITASLPNGTPGAPYTSTTLAASGGTGQGYTWSVTVGQLPSGLTLSSAGVLSGTLSTSATNSTFTVQVQDSGGSKATQQFTVTLSTQLTITTTSLPDGTPGAQYPTTTLTAAGGTGQGYSWSLAGGRLPTGLTLSSAGVLSGTLSSWISSTTFTVQVQDSGGHTTSTQLTLTVTADLTIAALSLPNSAPGAQYTPTTLTASGGTGQGYTWAVTLTGQLPAGLTLSPAGVLSGTLSTSATSSTFTIQVQDSGGNRATRQFSITVTSQIAITTASLPAGTPGAPYTSATLAASGGTGQGYSWSVTVGQLPSGLTLSAAGVLSGTLSSSATSSTFTVQVQDSGGNRATQQFTITLYSQLTITTASLPNGITGAQYTSTTLAAAGGTGQGYTWSVTVGQLPSGLTLSSAGVLSGTLSSSATSSTFTIQVQDSGGSKTTQQFTITVSPQLIITTASLPIGTPGAQYTSTTLTASSGTGQGYTWSVTVGQLPSGLTLSSAGVLSGTLSSSAASSTFTIQVQDSGGNRATKQFTITIGSPVTITTASLPNGTPGAQYASTTLGASGGTGQGYTWSVTVGQLPSGLTLSSAGVLSGTLSSSATSSTFTIQVQDSGGNKASQQFTIALPLTITTSALPVGTPGEAYSATLAASGGTGQGYTWSRTSGRFPPGLTLSSAGVLSGTLSSWTGSSTFTVQVQDSGGNTTSTQLILTVTADLTITTLSLPNGAPGAQYTSATLTAGGGTGQGYSWSVTVGQLPSGLTLSAAGVLSGTLSSSASSSTFTVQVEDSGGNRATKQLTITIGSPLTVTTTSLPNGTPGAQYTSTTLTASGGTGQGYSWSVTVGQLPNGLTLSSAGVLSGTLSSSATSSTFTVQVQDNGGNKATKQFTISVNSQLTITTASLPNGTPGAQYTSTTLTASGGTGQGYSWSLTVGQLPSGLTLSSAGALSGTLSSSATSSTFTAQVQDGGGNKAAQQFTINVSGTVNMGAITVTEGGGDSSSFAVGLYLQMPVTITLSPAPSADLSLTISSGNATSVLVGNAGTGGLSSLTVTVPAGTMSVQTYVQAVAAAASPVTVTASATNYTSGTASVAIANSAFVLSGLNGIGIPFTAYQSTITPLTVYSGRLDSTGLFAEGQEVAGGLSFTVPLAVMDSTCLSPSGLGTLSPTSLTLTGGTSTATVNFTASGSSTGGACVILTQPPGYSFTNPNTGAALNVTVQQSGLIAPSVTVGQNLQTTASVGLTGNAPTNILVTITSSDPTKLKFASGTGCATSPGSASITVTIPQNRTSTLDFCVFGYASTGSIPYTISAAGYGSVDSSIPMGPSGLAVQTSLSGGVVTNFTITQGSGFNELLYVFTALLDGSGNVLAEQAPASDVTVNATVTSSNTTTGTITSSPIIISGGSSYAATAFHPLALGTTTITASADGLASASVAATVTSAGLILNNSLTIGQYLEQQGQVILSAPAPLGGEIVTLTSNSPLLQLAANATDAGSNSITVTVPAAGNIASYWVYALASSGTATYAASAPDYGPATDTVTFAPSGILILGGVLPQICDPCTESLAAGAATLSVLTAQLSSDGSNTLQTYQPLAGSVALSVTLDDTNQGAGTVPGSVLIQGGTQAGLVTFTPVLSGSTTISITEPDVSANWPNGWTTPTYPGYNLLQLQVTVGP